MLAGGRFGEKLRLFFMLFTDWRVAWTSWVFFLARILLETLFVAAIPLSAILFIDLFRELNPCDVKPHWFLQRQNN